MGPPLVLRRFKPRDTNDYLSTSCVYMDSSERGMGNYTDPME